MSWNVLAHGAFSQQHTDARSPDSRVFPTAHACRRWWFVGTRACDLTTHSTVKQLEYMKGGLHIKNDDLRGIHSRIASPYAMSESKELDPRAWESPEVRLRVSSDVRVYLAQTKTGGFLNLGICLGLELDLVVLAVLLHLGEGGDDAVDDASTTIAMEHGMTQSTGFWLPTRPRTKTPTGVPMKQPI